LKIRWMDKWLRADLLRLAAVRRAVRRPRFRAAGALDFSRRFSSAVKSLQAAKRLQLPHTPSQTNRRDDCKK
jgi:hypothetical protein